MTSGDQPGDSARADASARHARLGRLFDAARELDGAARDSFLVEQTANDPSLRAELDALLAAADAPGVVEAIERGIAREAEAVAEADASPPASLAHYRVERELGRGAMGVVYLATDTTLGRRVALKLLPPEKARSRSRVQRFEREARAAAALNHPGIVTLHSLHEADGSRFLIMEYVEGAPLQVPAGGLEPSSWLDFATQLAAAVAAAHRVGIVHRDLKPQNVLVTPDLRIKVCDFGVAKLVRLAGLAELPAEPSTTSETSSSTALGAVVGTVPYMSPEQARGGDVDLRSDVFSLGVMLWEMATGRRPFRGPDLSSLLASILRDEPAALTTERPDLGPKLSAIVGLCLVKDRDARLASAEVLHARLLEAARRGDVDDTSERDAGSDLIAVPEPEHASSLPAAHDGFVARHEEIEQIAARFGDGARLVTLLGPGGMGKTRLACRFARARLDRWPGGAWFADLTEARSIDGIASAVAQALDVPLGKGDSVEKLGAALAGHGRCLLVLDNFEQIVEHARTTAARWLEAAPQIEVLVTSRVCLGLEAERTIELPPLAEEGALELFALRARERLSSFALTDSNRDDVRAVVALVDGVPLAVELAAARAGLLTPAQIRARLAHRFRLLSDARRGDPRQATMRATIDWSWQMLEPWEQAALAQASVFVGGMTMAAAEAVIDLGPWPDAPWTLDVVEALVRSSMLRRWQVLTDVDGEEELRFGMYANIHAFVAEKLETEGAISDHSAAAAVRTTQERHAAHFAGLGTDDAIDALESHGGVARARRLGLELDNLLAGFDRAIDRRDPAAVALHAAAWAVLDRRGPIKTAVELSRRLLAAPPCLTAAKATQVRALLARALWRAGDLQDAREHFEAALASHGEMGDTRGRGRLNASLGLLHMDQGRPDDARACYLEALDLSRACDDQRTRARALHHLGILLRATGQPEAAKAHFEQALTIHRELGSRRSEGNVLLNLGVSALQQGELDAAVARLEQALAMHRESGDRRLEAVTLGNLANACAGQGRLDVALDHGRRALAIAREVGERRFEGTLSGSLGSLLLDRSEPDQALPLLEQALLIHREIGERRFEGVARRDLGCYERDCGRVSEALEHFEAALAIHQEVSDRRGVGITLREVAKTHLRDAQLDDARASIDDAEAILRDLQLRVELADLLCTSAACHLAGGDTEAARAAREEASRLAEVSGAGSGSAIAQSLSDLDDSFDSAAGPEAMTSPGPARD